MAASSLHLFTSAINKINSGAIDVGSETIVCALVSSGYTVDGNHSVYATQVASNECSWSGASALKKLTNVTLTKSSSTAVKLTADNVTFTAGTAFSAKYAILYMDASDELLAYEDLDSGGNEVYGNTITIKWSGGASSGIVFKVRSSGI